MLDKTSVFTCCKWSKPISSSAIFFSMDAAILSPSRSALPDSRTKDLNIRIKFSEALIGSGATLSALSNIVLALINSYLRTWNKAQRQRQCSRARSRRENLRWGWSFAAGCWATSRPRRPALASHKQRRTFSGWSSARQRSRSSVSTGLPVEKISLRNRCIIYPNVMGGSKMIILRDWRNGFTLGKNSKNSEHYKTNMNNSTDSYLAKNKTLHF